MTEKSAVEEDEYSDGILSFDDDDIPDPEDAPKGEPEKPKRVVKERLEQLQLTEEQVSKINPLGIFKFQLPFYDSNYVNFYRKRISSFLLVCQPKPTVVVELL